MAIKVTPPPRPELAFSDAQWQRWFKSLEQVLTNTGSILFNSLDFTGSNLTSLATRQHADLQALQGGTSGQYYHLTSAQSTALTGFDAAATKTTNYPVTAADGLLLGDATGGNITFTLPTAVGLTGKRYTVKKIDAGANTVTLAGAGGTELIDGATTKVLALQYASCTIEGDGTQWWIISTV